MTLSFVCISNYLFFTIPKKKSFLFSFCTVKFNSARVGLVAFLIPRLYSIQAFCHFTSSP